MPAVSHGELPQRRFPLADLAITLRSGLNSGSQNICPHLNSWNCKSDFIWKKKNGLRSYNQVKDLEMRDIIPDYLGSPKSNCK